MKSLVDWDQEEKFSPFNFFVVIWSVGFSKLVVILGGFEELELNLFEIANIINGREYKLAMKARKKP